MRRAVLYGGALALTLTGRADAAEAVICLNCSQEAAAVVRFAQTMGQWASQIDYMMRQYKQLESFYNAANHITISNFAPTLSLPGVENPLADASAFMNSLLGLGEATGRAMNLAQTWRWYKPSQTHDFAALEIQRREQGAGTIADQAQQGLAAAVQHLAGLRQLRDKIDAQGTAADQTALHSRITEETAALGNLQHQASNLRLLISQQSQVTEVRSLEKQRQDSECVMAGTYADAMELGVASFGGATGRPGCSSGGSGSGGTTTADDGSVVLASASPDDGVVSDASGTAGPATDSSLSGFSGALANNPLGGQIASNAEALGVNPAAVEAACTAESNCRNGSASGTGANGPMQVIGSTYNQTRSEIAVSNPDIAAQMTGNNDPVSNYAAGTQYLRNAATSLQAAGVANPNGVDGRAYYMFGPAYGASVALAPDSSTMGSLVTNANSLAVNRISPSMTVGQWRSNVATRMGGNAYAPILLPQTTASN